MNCFRLVLVSCALGVAALPALAESSASSAVSDSFATSAGSLSGSVKKSSNSSSKDKDVAAGDYRIVEVAAVAERPGHLRLKLQALADGNSEFLLLLPQEAFDRGRLTQGDLVTASQRPYGLEFASGEARQAFFLVLRDDWYRELNSKPVVL